jgi:hypothetical protein
LRNTSAGFLRPVIRRRDHAVFEILNLCLIVTEGRIQGRIVERVT